MQKINNWLWQDKKISKSTNDDALIYSSEVVNQNFIISAEEQTNGRGRRSKEWISEKGNLFFSQGLEFSLQRVNELVCLCTLSLYQTILSLISQEHKVEIKWPNDILIDGAKVSGILLEKGAGEYIVIGIGVNIRHFPTSQNLNYDTTSLCAKGISVDRLTFLRSYINNFDNNYVHLQSFGFSDIRKLWLSSVKGIGEEISVVTDNDSVIGKFEGIGDNGELLLMVQNKLQKFYTGDVFYMKRER